MAFNKLIVTFGIAFILFPTIATATEYVIGDANGWTINFDYQAWAKNKVFLVGDKLGMHTFYMVLPKYILCVYIIYKNSIILGSGL